MKLADLSETRYPLINWFSGGVEPTPSGDLATSFLSNNKSSGNLYTDMRIVTERLILRDVTSADLDPLYSVTKDPEVFRYWPSDPDTYQGAKERIERMIRNQTKTPRTDFDVAITLLSNKKLIGRCRIRKSSDIQGHFGYMLAKDMWGKGYATEVAKALVGYGFGELNLHRIFATTHPENPASNRVIQKAGLVLEGRLREDRIYDGEFKDSLIYSILRQEWETQNP